MPNVKRDENRVTAIAAQTDDANATFTPLVVDPATGRLKVNTTITGSITAASASVGATGSPVPASADYIGFKDGSGNLTGVTIGQQTAANSIPVILPSATITTLTPPAAITNFALETGGNLAAIKADVDKIPSLGQALAAGSVPVVLTAAQLTTLTPPAAITGFALEAGHLATIDTSTAKIPAQGQALMAASMPVVLASNQSSIPVAATLSVETTKVIGTVNIAASQTIGLAAGTQVIGHVIVDSGTITTVSAVTAITNALPAGTNNIGLVTPTPTSNSGWNFNYQSALTATKVQIKGSAGTFGGYINLYNPNTAVTFIQVFNKASANVTLGTTAPDFVITLPGIATASGTGSDRNLEIVCGLAMNTGITIAATTTASGSVAPANAIVATFLFL